MYDSARSYQLAGAVVAVVAAVAIALGRAANASSLGGSAGEQPFLAQELSNGLHFQDANRYLPVNGPVRAVAKAGTGAEADTGAGMNPNDRPEARLNDGPGDTSVFPMADCHGLPLEEASIDQMQGWMASGTVTSRQLTECYLARITQLNEYVNAILQVNPDVLSIAEQRDAERARGIVRGPLHGIPIAVKDTFATKDRMETTAGSYALLGSVVPRDAHVVRLLREKGAVLLGKTTLDEWASMRSNSKSSGYSARGGQSRNAYNLSTAPGDSSSGSSQAVAANMLAVAFGTETDGSIIAPASRAGIVGFKPTVGLTSRSGIIPESVHQDTVGTLGRTFRDAVYALEAIVGPDERDNSTLSAPAPAQRPPGAGGGGGDDYIQFLADRRALKSAVFGLPWSSLWNQTGNKPNLDIMLRTVERLKAAGATIINGTEFPHYREILSPDGWDWSVGLSPLRKPIYRIDVDFYNNIRDYLSELRGTRVRTLDDIIAYNDKYTAVEGGIPGTHPAFKSGQDSFLASAATRGAMNASYYECDAWLKHVSQDHGIDAALRHRHTLPDGSAVNLTALLVPSGGGSTNLPAVAGYPMVTVPVGYNAHSVPVGVSLIGTAWSEPMLVKFGSAIDDLVRGRKKPAFEQWWSRRLPVDTSM